LGFINEPSMKYDPHIADTMQNHLFEFSRPDGSMEAIDLLAMNINRGRDHGIPSYTTLRERCGQAPAVEFEDLSLHISPENIQILKSIYK
jgi:peroxidase